MTPYDGNKKLTFYHEAKQVLDGGMCVPRTALIYPSRACNQHCYFCSDHATNRELRGVFMDSDLLLVLPGQVADLGCEAVELCGGGEPFLHPDIGPFIEECAAHRLKLGTLTNGTRLRDSLAVQVLKHFSFIRISIDSFNPETYSRVRGVPATGPTSLDAVRSNIEALVRLKREMNSRCLITIKAVFSKDTLWEMPEYVRQGRMLGVDGINIKAVRNVDDALDLQPSAESIAMLESFKQGNRPGQPHVFGNLLRTRLETPICFACCFHVFIDTTGEVRLCCYYQNRCKAHTFGNMNHATLWDIWHGEAHRRAVRAIEPAKCNVYDCKYFGFNRELYDGIVNDAGQWQFT